MMKKIKKLLWPLSLASMVLAIPFFIFGIFQSFEVTQGALEEEVIMGENNREERQQEEEEESGDYRFVTLGDSLARGTGDEESLGFAGRTVSKLEEALEVSIRHENYAVEGLRIGGLIEQLENQDLLEEIQEAEAIMISIGGNDLRGIQRLPESERRNAFEILQTEYLENLNEMVRRIREENREALVVFLGLYNLDYSGENPEETELLLQWNANTYEAIEKEGNAVWVPTYDLFQFQLQELLSPDQLHLNGEGYEKIADRITEIIRPYFD